jgi:DnaJ family protein C protein 2
MTKTLPGLPVEWSAAESFAEYATFSSPVKRAVEPVGPGFLAHARRTLRGRTWSEDEKIQAQQNVKKVEDDSNDVLVEDEPENPDMLEKDPKDWKELDQYAVLGLSKYRYKATEEQIRVAHRRKVLKHHPDKKAAEGAINEDGFFKCIQKAFETVMDPVKRRQWDSVDPKADVRPSKTGKLDFISNWGAVFEAEGRFSNVQPVPSLGTMDSTKDEVDQFYTFFYNFDSWRTFEWLDEDVPDDTSNRDNKRYVERKNKAARQKRKTEDTARLRKLVDDALKVDPRIRMFKDAERKAKEQKKWDREAGTREAAAAAKKAAEQAEKKRIEDEKIAKEAREAAKKNKDAAKQAKKKNKRTVRGSVKDINYFAKDGEEPSAVDIDGILYDVDNLLEKLDDEGLQTVANKLNGQTDAEQIRTIFVDAVKHSGLTSIKYFK